MQRFCLKWTQLVRVIIESYSASRSRPKAKKSMCKPVAASSHLTASHGEVDLQIFFLISI